MDVQEIVDNWYALGSGKNIQPDKVPFFRFISIWIAFNALYASRYSSNTRGDRDQVRRFADEPKAIDSHQKLLKEDRDYQKAIEILKKCGVQNTRASRNYSINDITNLTEVVECLYQVRCNLFHGGKIPKNTRDQGLVEASYTIVSKLIKPYMSNFDVLNEEEGLAAMASDPQIQAEIVAINKEFAVTEMDGLK